MFTDKRKCIGVLTNETDIYFMETTCITISETANALGYDVAVFTTVGFRDSSSEYDRQERAMFSLVPLDDIAGLIVSPDTYQLSSFRDNLRNTLERFSGPIVTVRSDMDGYDTVYTDETTAIKCIIDHVIDFHGCTKLGFMAGYLGHRDGDLRLECFLREMDKRKLPLMPNAIFRGDMWHANIEEAYRNYFENGEENRPQAIVCANDYMALFLIDELDKHGIRVPQDVIVTGFDDTAAAVEHEPSLSSVARDYASMARESVLLLDERIKNREKHIPDGDIIARAIPTTLALHESCGCDEKNAVNHIEACRRLSAMVSNLSLCSQCQKYYLIESSKCQSLNDVRTSLTWNVPNMNNCKDFYVCLYTDEDISTEDDGLLHICTKMSDKVKLFAAYHDCEPVDVGVTTFDRRQILPEVAQSDEPQTMYVMMMHYGEKAFGYTVTKYRPGTTVDRMSHFWTVMLASVMQNLFNTVMLKRISEENHIKSVTDALTGISNRRGFYEKLEQVWDELCARGATVAFIETDLDGLKYINDTFGHNEGDKAIHVIGEAVVKAADDNSITARTGGDEFLTFISDTDANGANAYVKRFKDELKTLNKMLHRAYLIGASCGCYVVQLCNSTDPSECVRQADIQMYIEKRRRKLNHHTGEEIEE